MGVAPLQVDGTLQAAARAWAQQMAASGSLEHQSLKPFLGPFSRAAENIAYAMSVEQAHNALVASPGHYRNLANGNYTLVGIGVAVGADGRIWTSHVFAG